MILSPSEADRLIDAIRELWESHALTPAKKQARLMRYVAGEPA